MSTQNNIPDGGMLAKGTVLRNIYRIERYLASGGFSNTYVALNTEFGEQVAIKEFFLRGVSARDDDQISVSISNADSNAVFTQQKEKFKKEASRLRELYRKHHNEHLVGVHDIFEENGTAYYVMDFIDGENLRERMRRTGQPLTEDEVWQLLPQVLDALRTVHNEGLWHMDLKPGNIMVDRGGKAHLIDFGASKQLDQQSGGATAHTTVSFTPGYAPLEQMGHNFSKIGAWTDIYALGATLYALLTNLRPPTSSDIDEDDTPDKHEALKLPAEVSSRMRELIIKMMRPNRKQRPQSVSEVMQLIGQGSGSASGAYTGSAGHANSARSTQNYSEEEETQFGSSRSSGFEAEETQFGSSRSSGFEAEETQFGSSRSSGFEAEETQFGAQHLYNDYSEPAAQNHDDSAAEYYDEDSENSNSNTLKYVLIGLSVSILTFFATVFFMVSLNNDGTSTVAGVSLVVKGDDCVYSGSVDNKTGLPQGEGEARFTDGRYYRGEFNQGVMQGKGYFINSNGDTFEGEFKNNQYYQGTYTDKENDEHFVGYFANEEPSQGKWYKNSDNSLLGVVGTPTD